MQNKAQGTIEYLVIMAIVIVIGLLVVGLVSTLFDSSTGISSTSGKINSVVGPISISEAAVDREGDLFLVASNNTGENLTITSIGSGSDQGTLNSNWANLGSNKFYLDSIEACACTNPGSTISCPITFELTNRYGRTYTETINLTVDCINDVTSTNEAILPDQTVYLSECTTISSPGNYSLITDLLDVNENCSTITADDVNFDGNDKRITFANKGTGDFEYGGATTSDTRANSVASGDLDNDGDLDIFYARWSPTYVGESRSDQVYLNNGNGTFVLSQELTDNNDASTDSEIGDFDNDGNLDLLTANFTGYSAAKAYLGDGTGNFTLAWSAPQNVWVRSVFLADFDNDGNQDFVIGTNNSTCRVYLGNGDGTFTYTWNTTESGWTYSFAATDFDQDGNLDIITTHTAGSYIYSGNGDGTFSLEKNYIWDSPFGVSIGDIDNDGDMDFVQGGANTNDRVYINNGNWNFVNDSNSLKATEHANSVVFADLNGDGYLDYIVTNNYKADDIYLNDGDGTFTLFDNTDNSGGYGTLSAGDFDGDGDIDYITSDSFETNKIYFNSSTTTTDGNYLVGIQASSVSNLTITDLNIEGFSRALKIENSSNINISDSSFTKSSLDAAKISNLTGTNVFENNVFDGFNNGLNLQSSTGVTLTNNYFCGNNSTIDRTRYYYDISCPNSSIIGSGNSANVTSTCNSLSFSLC